jgi:hypothetical protein
MWDHHSKTEYIDTVKSTAESIAENMTANLTNTSSASHQEEP